MHENIIAISATAIESKLQGKTELEDIIKTAMDAALTEQCTWLIADENLKFNAAIAAIFMVVDEETKDRIKKEIHMLKALNAAFSGVPVDFGALPIQENADNAIGLMKYWHAAVARKKKGETHE